MNEWERWLYAPRYSGPLNTATIVIYVLAFRKNVHCVVLIVEKCNRSIISLHHTHTVPTMEFTIKILFVDDAKMRSLQCRVVANWGFLKIAGMNFLTYFIGLHGDLEICGTNDIRSRSYKICYLLSSSSDRSILTKAISFLYSSSTIFHVSRRRHDKMIAKKRHKSGSLSVFYNLFLLRKISFPTPSEKLKTCRAA